LVYVQVLGGSESGIVGCDISRTDEGWLLCQDAEFAGVLYLSVGRDGIVHQFLEDRPQAVISLVFEEARGQVLPGSWG